VPEQPERVTSSLLRGWPPPPPGSDKDSRGSLLVVGGSRSTPGAVVLAGEAALRVGAGKVQVATVGSVSTVVASLVPEALVRGCAESQSGELVPAATDDVLAMAEAAAVVLLGPGLPAPEGAADLLEAVVPRLAGTVVVDALGSAFLTRHPDGVRHLQGRCVLTLNHTEVLRTLGEEDDRADRDGDVDLAQRLAERSGAVVLCGGSRKVVATPEGRCWIVDEGDAGLGISGSGDVQAGLVAGLLARGAAPDQAAVWGAFLHGTAGQRLAESVGRVGFLARELPPVVPALVESLGGA
jgi:ADP-dependent NAD(P)H-hydrate dehydratase